MSPLLAAALVATAAIYTWTDQDGVEHYTDDPSSIPRGAKVRKTQGDDVSTIQPEVKPVKPQVVAPQPAPVAPAQPAMPSQSEQHWRDAFRAARTRIAELEGEIEDDRAVVEEVSGLPQTARFSCVPGYWPVVGVPPVGSTAIVTVNGQPAPGLNVTGSWNTQAGAPLWGTGGCFVGPNAEYERLRERLARNRRALVRAREELADLERRASFEAVPLHWRR